VRGASLLFLSTTLAACAAVLGIEDTVDEAPSTADGGSGRGAGDAAAAGEDGAVDELVPAPKGDGGDDPGSEPEPVDGGPDAEGGVAPDCDLTKPFGAPKMLAVNTTAYETGGRLSSDELTIWFARRSTATSTDGDIWTAKRATKEAAFAGRRRSPS